MLHKLLKNDQTSIVIGYAICSVMTSGNMHMPLSCCIVTDRWTVEAVRIKLISDVVFVFSLQRGDERRVGSHAAGQKNRQKLVMAT